MKKLLKNPWFIGYAVLYIITMLLMNVVEKQSVADYLSVQIIVGIGFTLVAHMVSRNATALYHDSPVRQREVLLLVLLVLYISFFLAYGTDWINRLLPAKVAENMRLVELIKLAKKVLFFVFIPWLAYAFANGFRAPDFGLSLKAGNTFTRKNLFIFAVLSVVMFLFQFFLGNGAKPVREGIFSSKQLLIALPLCWIWLIVEVGLVEEFFFRALLQSRLTVVLKSETGGILLSGLIFGLAHAPGMYLRGSGTLEGLGLHPSLFITVGYSILVLSLAGFFLAIIWSRTKNLLLIMAIHAFADLLPAIPEFIKLWGIN